MPGEIDVALGEEVDLEIAFVEEQVRFHIRAIVRWKRPAAGRRMEPGVGLGFLSSEHTTKNRLLSFVRGEDVDHVEREGRRYALHLEVKLTLTDAPARVVSTDDLSVGGCFLLVDRALAIGTVVELTLRAPGAIFSWLTLKARVAWRRSHGERVGVGVEFLFVDDAQRHRMEKLLAVLRERLGREVHVQPVRTGTAPPASSPPSTSPPGRSSMLPRK